MKDLQGREINIMDVVAFAKARRSKAILGVGVVVKIRENGVSIRPVYQRDGLSASRKTMPMKCSDNILIVKRKANDKQANTEAVSVGVVASGPVLSEPAGV